MIWHFLLAFSTLAIQQNIKTDNGPAYTSQKFHQFLNQWGMKHGTGIPNSLLRLSIVDRAHQMIKKILDQQRAGTETIPSIERLCKVTYVFNFLNNSFMEPGSPIIRHLSNNTQAKFEENLQVLIKDHGIPADRGPFPTHHLVERVRLCLRRIRPKVDSREKHCPGLGQIQGKTSRRSSQETKQTP